MAVFNEYVDGKNVEVSRVRTGIHTVPVFLIASLPGGMDVLSRKQTKFSSVFCFARPSTFSLKRPMK